MERKSELTRSFTCQPAVWQLISKGIQAQVRNGGRIKSTLFHLAYVAKKWAGADSYIAQLLDAVVFKAVKQATGGRLVWGVSGGAPLSRETQEFLSMALVKVIQGLFPILLYFHAIFGLC